MKFAGWIWAPVSRKLVSSVLPAAKCAVRALCLTRGWGDKHLDNTLFTLANVCKISDSTLVDSCIDRSGHFLPHARLALETGDRLALAGLMDRNFDTRRRLFGDAVLGEVNLRMIECARSVGGGYASLMVHNKLASELLLLYSLGLPDYLSPGWQWHIGSSSHACLESLLHSRPFYAFLLARVLFSSARAALYGIARCGMKC